MAERPTPNRALFFWLYFFEGAPIGLIWWTIPTLLATQNVPIEKITTMTAAAALPWSFKFLAGPLVDRFISTERQHAWGIAALQISMLGGLFFIQKFSLETSFLPLVILLISLSSALQDVVIDAWAIASVSESNRGRINGAMQAGMLSGRWAFGAGLLMGLSILDWKSAIAVLMSTLALSILFLFVRYSKNDQEISIPVRKINWRAFSFLKQPKFLYLGAIALLTGFAFESVGSVVGPFLLTLGYLKTDIGGILSGTLVLMLAGSLLGGWLSDKIGAGKVFFGSGIAIGFANIILATATFTTMPIVTFGFLMLVYLFIGFFTSSSYAFYMSHSKGEMEATKFTFLMAITNLCEASAALITGRIAASYFGYAGAFLAAALISTAGLVLLKKVVRIRTHETKTL